MGLVFYTIGQRQGLGVGGQRPSDSANENESEGGAWYVAAKDVPNNRLLVVQGHSHGALLQTSLSAERLNWISGSVPHCNWVYGAKTRYRQRDAPCAITYVDRERCDVDFAEAQWAITPGQSIVIYESRVCLGGGIIRS
jgi:tRNA-specific 2-thiouridylase